MDLLALIPDPVPISDWEIWAPHTWAPWLSMRLFRAALFLLGAFVLSRAWCSVLKRLKAAALKRDPVGGKDLEQRLDTIAAAGRKIVSITLYLSAALIILADFGVQVVPLLAGLGIAGMAVGFGAQYMVRDLINGFFLVAEDQFRVGDLVKLGEFSGTVENITLRTTQIRSVRGELHTVPNGEIRTVTNMNRQWARAIVDVGVSYGASLDQVFEALREAGRRIETHEALAGTILEPPEVVGVTDLADSAIVVRLWIKLSPSKRWEAERLMRRTVTEVFGERGIEIPFPQRTLTLDTSTLDALRKEVVKP